jgi:hypothetical protein
MYKHCLSIIFLLFAQFINAQILLPYLSNGLYGLADENMKIIVPVQYQDIRLFSGSWIDSS